MPESILLPLDGSDVAERAIPWAIALAQSQRSPVTLLEVTPWPPERPARQLTSYLTAEAIDRIRAATARRAQRYLEGVQPRLAAAGVQTNVVVTEGQPADVITETAARTGASTIVMGTHGHGGIARALLGSTAQQVLRNARVPVLLVRGGQPTSDRPQLQRVLVPLDGSTISEAALPLAAKLAGPGATVILTRVVEPITTIVSAGFDDGATVVDAQATIESVQAAQSYLDQRAERVKAEGLKTVTVARTGDPGPEIRAAARDERADVIVMSTHGRSGLSRWLMGSVTDDLVRGAERPVLVASPQVLLSRTLAPASVGEIMERRYVRLSSSEPIPVAIRKLLRGRVSGAPVVDASGQLVGVLSEHDVLAWHDRYAQELISNESLLEPSLYRERAGGTTVGTLMSAPAISVDDRASVDTALRLFLNRGLGRLPVTHDGRLVGVLGRAEVLESVGRRLRNDRNG